MRPPCGCDRAVLARAAQPRESVYVARARADEQEKCAKEGHAHLSMTIYACICVDGVADPSASTGADADADAEASARMQLPCND